MNREQRARFRLVLSWGVIQIFKSVFNVRKVRRFNEGDDSFSDQLSNLVVIQNEPIFWRLPNAAFLELPKWLLPW